MPILAPPEKDEKEQLLAYIKAQRDAVRASLHGLDREQATSTPSASANSVAGLLKHSAITERGWIVGRMMQREIPAQRPQDNDYMESFTVRDDESVQDILDYSYEVERETEQIVRELADLDFEVPVPDSPYFPKDLKSWPARWVLLHVIEEWARHAGHADIIRESIDGSNAFVNQMKAEGENPEWMQRFESK
jgi:hypothetical protein